MATSFLSTAIRLLSTLNYLFAAHTFDDASASGVRSNVKQLDDVLRSKEGQELKQSLSSLANHAVDVFEEPLRRTQTIVNDMIDKQITAAEKIALDAVGIIPGVGEAVEAVRTGADIVRAGEHAAESVAQLTDVAADAAKPFQQMKRDVSAFTTKLQAAVDRGRALPGTAPKTG